MSLLAVYSQMKFYASGFSVIRSVYNKRTTEIETTKYTHLPGKGELISAIRLISGTVEGMRCVKNSVVDGKASDGEKML